MLSNQLLRGGGEEGWSVTFAIFHGVNSPTIANFRLPASSSTAWEFLEVSPSVPVSWSMPSPAWHWLPYIILLTPKYHYSQYIKYHPPPFANILHLKFWGCFTYPRCHVSLFSLLATLDLWSQQFNKITFFNFFVIDRCHEIFGTTHSFRWTKC